MSQALLLALETQQLARTQFLSSWSFQSSYSLLPYGHPVLLLCWVLISTGFPGLQLYVWVLVSSTQLCSICSLSSLFVHISSAIYDSWLQRHNLTSESKLGMCQGLEYRTQKLMSVCFSLRFILFLKGQMVPIWGTSIIQPSVIRLLNGVANLVPHGPCA